MIQGINHITLSVTDVHRSFDFYRQVLGFKPIVRWDKGAYFLVGDFWFCLNQGVQPITGMGCTHYAFSVSPEDFATMTERIIQAGVKMYKENTSPGDSLYFLDPDGHQLEIHVGNWQARIAAKKQNIGTWQAVEWFM